jgi:hypothetical protein
MFRILISVFLLPYFAAPAFLLAQSSAPASVDFADYRRRFIYSG